MDLQFFPQGSHEAVRSGFLPCKSISQSLLGYVEAGGASQRPGGAVEGDRGPRGERSGAAPVPATCSPIPWTPAQMRKTLGPASTSLHGGNLEGDRDRGGPKEAGPAPAACFPITTTTVLMTRMRGPTTPGTRPARICGRLPSPEAPGGTARLAALVCSLSPRPICSKQLGPVVSMRHACCMHPSHVLCASVTRVICIRHACCMHQSRVLYASVACGVCISHTCCMHQSRVVYACHARHVHQSRVLYASITGGIWRPHLASP